MPTIGSGKAAAVWFHSLVAINMLRHGLSRDSLVWDTGYSNQQGAAMSSDPDRIYLTPHCGSAERCCEPERLWADEPGIAECSECDLPPVEYLLAASLIRVLKDEVKAAYPDVCDDLVRHNYYAGLMHGLQRAVDIVRRPALPAGRGDG
jgi:hypothetical protein